MAPAVLLGNHHQDYWVKLLKAFYLGRTDASKMNTCP